VSVPTRTPLAAAVATQTLIPEVQTPTAAAAAAVPRARPLTAIPTPPRRRAQPAVPPAPRAPLVTQAAAPAPLAIRMEAEGGAEETEGGSPPGNSLHEVGQHFRRGSGRMPVMW
jgi:hypothetical protein